jgi:hypothetical protein
VKVTLPYTSDELELTETSVIIRKRGIANAMASGINGDRTIAIQSLTAVQLKLGGFMPGYILFAYAGSKPFRGGLMEATQDPDAFVFNKSSNHEIEGFKSELERRMDAARTAKVGTHQISLADELGKLAKLKADGILSSEEFDAAKRRLLQ